MSDQKPNQPQTQPEQKKHDLVRCRMLVNMVVERQYREVNGIRELVDELEVHPGDVVELPRAEAERLAGRKFVGYGTNRDGENRIQCAAYPTSIPGGGTVLVKDPLVEIL